jgi:vacuolar protein sorting-associated protein 35
LAKGNPEVGLKMYLEAALTADRYAASTTPTTTTDQATWNQIAYELISQAFALYEENTGDSKLQRKCIVSSVGTLLACRSLQKEEYESVIMKMAQYAAKMLKKSDQCEMVALCSHLFFVVDENVSVSYVWLDV